ncbi:MAG: rok family protein [Spirochaetes bacterium]|nr:MAG: rok family protein [Spirochaetota bacterium]
MDTDGPICGCGKRGCLHVYASGGALARRAEIFLADEILPSALKTGKKPGRVTGEEVCAAAAKGDVLALDCVKEAAHYLGIAAANIITSYNPDKIVLGGPIGRIEGPLLEMVAQVAKSWSMPHAYSAVSFGQGILGDSVGALGGACRVLDLKLSLASSVPPPSPGP